MFSEKMELAINNAGWDIEGNTLIHSDCVVNLPENTDDTNVLENLRQWLDNTNNENKEAVYLFIVLDNLYNNEGYCFAVHCNEQANPAESIEVIAFDNEEDRDTFINNEAWPYEAVENVTDIYAGPFWDWEDFKSVLADFRWPSRAEWQYDPKSTEPIIMVEG